MKTYLSIDLDFWNQGKSSLPHMRKFLQMAKDAVAPSKLTIVDSHEELLPYVNDSGCDTLINIDWHSDISNRFDPAQDRPAWKRLNCGTWVNFVEFRNNGYYMWIHPYRASERSARGYCHYPHTPKHNPFVNTSVGGWNALSERKNKHPEDLIDFGLVTHVGVVFSYDWVKFDKIWEDAHKVLGFKPEHNKHALLS